MITKKTLFGIIIISLFIGTIAVRAETLYEIEYPATAIIDEAFEIKVLFTYQSVDDCLYGSSSSNIIYVYLFYSINNPYVATSIIGDNVLFQGLPSSSPRPESKTFTIRPDSPTHPFDFEVDDIFRFKIRYTNGILIDGVPTRAIPGLIISDIYEVTIIDIPTTETSLPFVSLFSALMILSVFTVILRKTKR